MSEKIRRAFPEEEDVLTRIAFAAKRTWNYPEHYFDVWANELTITQEYILCNTVFVFEKEGVIAGFYSLVLVVDDFFAGKVLVEKGYWLEHLFIDPVFQHQGIGQRLMEHACIYCRENQIKDLKIFVDPHAVGFYEKLGAAFLRNSPSSIEGRDVPVYWLKIWER